MVQDQAATILGRDVKDPDTEFGASMHGVSGMEPTFLPSSYTKTGFDSVEASHHGGVSHKLDKYGRPFRLPVDNENRAKRLSPVPAYPHMLSFYVSTFAFFASFFATFAPAALITVIRENIVINKYGVNDANVAAVIAAVAARVVLGLLCDAIGPRLSFAVLVLGCAVPTYCMALVQTEAGLIAARFFIGLALASFVTNQYWSSVMFSANVVGLANGLSAGFGNSGGGFTNIIMPEVLASLEKYHPPFRAWRFAFFFPGVMMTVSGLLCLLFGEDCPDGSYRELVETKKKAKVPFKTKLRTIFYAIRQLNVWILVWSYSISFGIELVNDNNLSQYFVDTFGKNVQEAGRVASSFGIMAIVVRPLGGYVSDMLARKVGGMRARIWNICIPIALGGMFSMLMSHQTHSYSATVGLLVAYAFCTLWATGAVYSVTPFISRRALGVVSGLVGAGGNAGAGLWQGVYFTQAKWSTSRGFFYLGLTQACGSALLLLMYFPQWGGMLLPAKKGVTNERYYLSEYTTEEIKEGLATSALKFAEESSYHSNPEWFSKKGQKTGDDASSVDDSTRPSNVTASTVTDVAPVKGV